MRSVQPEWCLALPIQQQCVLFLAGRGPDGVAKTHPCKAVQMAYRACVFRAAKYGRELRWIDWGEKADSFMSLDIFSDDLAWRIVTDDFFQHIDNLPHHYLMHLMHGVEILGYKHPDERFRARWLSFYRRMVSDLHLVPESETAMDDRLGDWGQKHWDET